MSLSDQKFLLDENVHARLLTSLERKDIAIEAVGKGEKDATIAQQTRKEQRVLITNDSDFIRPEKYGKGDIYAVVWLRIPQRDVESLTSSFEQFLRQYEGSIQDTLIVLKPGSWDTYEIGERHGL